MNQNVPTDKIKQPDLVSLFQKENVSWESIGLHKDRSLNSTKGLNIYTGEFGTSQKKHLLQRTLIGYSHTSYTQIQNLSLSACVDMLLSPEKAFDLPINDYYLDIIDNPDEVKNDVARGAVWVNALEVNQGGARWVSLKSWMLKQFNQQSTSIHWRMVLFYNNLLVSSIQNAGISKNAFYYVNTLFNLSLGNFKELIYQVTIDPSMLIYLNGNQNNKYAPDENYARELQELFTVGKGPNSKYTEKDVSEMARLLTGWQFDWEKTKTTEGRAIVKNNLSAHDTGDKQFSEFYGNRKISGSTNPDRADGELREAIDMICATDEMSKYICRRIYRFFVNPNIDQSTEDLIITPLAKIFKDAKFEILPVLRTLLLSEHFYDSMYFKSMVKSPLDFVVGLLKEFDLPLLDNNYNPFPKGSDGIYYEFKRFNGLQNAMISLGMNIGDPPSVSGWPAYYQEPAYDLFWINSETIIKRAQFTDSLFNWGQGVYYNSSTKTYGQVRANLANYLRQFNNPGDLEGLVDQLVDRHIGMSISTNNRQLIISQIMQGNANLNYWTELWNTYIANPSTENSATIQNRMAKGLGFIYQMGESQLF
jgi:uncharacterized protein (DUF1800 family)